MSEMNLNSISSVSYAKTKMWDRGIRLLHKDDPHFDHFVTDCLDTHLGAKDGGGFNEREGVKRLLDRALKALWNNLVSGYRNGLKKRESPLPLLCAIWPSDFSPMDEKDYKENQGGDTPFTVPDHKLIERMFHRGPSMATHQEREAMQFFYQVVLPRATAGDLKDGMARKSGMTYWEALGEKWSFTIATAMILCKHYSDISQIAENAKQEGRKEPRCTARGKATGKRKRLRLHTKDQERIVSMELICKINWLNNMRKVAFHNRASKLEQVIGKWDTLFNPACNGTQLMRAQDRPIICPPEKRQKKKRPEPESHNEGRKAMIEMMESQQFLFHAVAPTQQPTQLAQV